MSDLDPTARDELVSSFLDGEATPAERAQIEGDPELLRRAVELRSVADLVATPILVDRGLRSAQIDAALAQSSTAPNIASLETRRKRRLDPRVLSAAAVVLAAIVALPFVFNSEGDDTTAALNVLDGSDAETSSDGDRTASAESSDGSASQDLDDAAAMGAPLAPILDLGEVSDIEGLASVISQKLVGEAENTDGASDSASLGDAGPQTSAGYTAVQDCPEVANGGPVAIEGVAMVAGELRWFAVFDSRELALIDPETCRVLERFPLP